MDIKGLREKSNLSQKAFGERLGLSPQSILNYEAGKNVPESIKKLIRYEFAEYLPEDERLQSTAPAVATADPTAVEALNKENEELREKLKNSERVAELLERNVELLEDQVKLYKDRLNITKDKSKSA